MNFLKRIDGSDVMIIAGFGVMGYGLYLIYPPLTPLVIGIIMLLIGLWGAFRKGSG